MIPFATIQGFITSTSNLIRETNANTCQMVARLDRIEATQYQLTCTLTALAARLNEGILQQAATASTPVATSVPGPRTLINEFFAATPGTNYVHCYLQAF